MKILVAGATGLVGTELVKRLAASHSVMAMARTPRYSVGIEWHAADLSAPPQSWSLPSHWDVTVYLAQSRGYREFPSQAADMVAVNVHAPVALLELSRARGAGRFVLASTANVYGMSTAAIDERIAVNPTSFYARTRRAAELLAEPFQEHLDVVIARLFTVYGPAQRPDTLIASIIDRVANGRPVQVQGDRGLLLSPVFQSDAVEAIAALAEKPLNSRGFTIVNVAGAETVGIGELAATVGRIVGRPPVIDRVAGTEPGGWIGETAALRSLTGWQPRVPLAQGLQQTVAARAV